MTKIDSAEPSTRAQAEGLVAGQNMFRKFENLNFVIVSDFVLRISHFDISIRTISFGVIFVNYFWDVILVPGIEAILLKAISHRPKFDIQQFGRFLLNPLCPLQCFYQ